MSYYSSPALIQSLPALDVIRQHDARHSSPITALNPWRTSQALELRGTQVQFHLYVDSFSPSDLLFQRPNPTHNSGHHVKRIGASIACVLCSSVKRYTKVYCSGSFRSSQDASLMGMNSTEFLPLLREEPLTPFVLVRVGYDERAFASQFLLAPHHLLQISSALRLRITLGNGVTISLCLMEPSLLVNVVSMKFSKHDL